LAVKRRLSARREDEARSAPGVRASQLQQPIHPHQVRTSVPSLCGRICKFYVAVWLIRIITVWTPQILRPPMRISRKLAEANASNDDGGKKAGHQGELA